jgi:vanillate O-demethylase ferredoxin subunit
MVDVHLPNGLTRQYSLCNDPAESHRDLIGVLMDPASRGGSEAMQTRLNEGDTLSISTPKNHFPLAHDARRSMLLAGGIRDHSHPVHGRAAGGCTARTKGRTRFWA